MNLGKIRPTVNLGKRRPAVNLGKRRATPVGRHPIRVPVQHSASAAQDTALNLPAAGQLPQVPKTAGRGTAPVPEFDSGVWTRDLDATPLGPPTALPDATPAALPTDMLEMPALPAELVALPTEPLGIAEDLLPTAAMPILVPPEPVGLGTGQPVGVGAAQQRQAPTEPLPVALRPDSR